MSLLSGIHPVAEALRAGSPLERIVIAQGAGGPRLQEIIDLARRAHVPVRFEPRSSLDRLASSAAHQGVIALGAGAKRQFARIANGGTLRRAEAFVLTVFEAAQFVFGESGFAAAGEVGGDAECAAVGIGGGEVEHRLDATIHGAGAYQRGIEGDEVFQRLWAVGHRAQKGIRLFGLALDAG